MLPISPFLQLTLPRVEGFLRRLRSAIWVEVAPVSVAFGGIHKPVLTYPEAGKLNYKPIELPFHWGYLFDQGWFRLELPKVVGKEQLYLHWQDEGEGTAFLKGTPYYGFDVAHKYCPVPAGASTMYVEGLCLQSAFWYPGATGLHGGGSLLAKAALCHRNDLAWHCWHDLRVLFELAIEVGKAARPMQPPKSYGVGFQPPIDIVPVLYRRLLRSMDDAIDAFETGGLPAMRRAMKKIYAGLKGQHDRITAVLTGHAHLDLVWLWPERTAEYKAVHTFSTMNRLMDTYPEFVFGYSQPASYDAVGKISPPLIREVKKRIKRGSWEALGATEVESDTLMACGEALARSFILGQKGFERLQGKPSKILWIPDVFGYCGALPQIMKQTGVEYFFTTKLTWCNINRFPYSSFVWRGIDGSEVIVHVTQENGYNQTVVPEELRRGSDAYRQSDIHDEFLAPTGFGDGGGGVTEEMCERARRVASLAGLPATRWGRVDAFFEKLAEKRDQLPAWQGELYLEYHRGVLTTHSNLKALFRGAERALQAWEAVRCVRGGGEVDEKAWRRAVFAQFHDYIPGSSIWEVYEEGLPELEALAKQALTSAAAELSVANKDAEPALFNPLPIDRIVALPGKRKGAIHLPALSGGPISQLARVTERAPVLATAKKISSLDVTATFDAKGQIASLHFKKMTVPIAAPLAAPVIYPDSPHEFEAWDIDRQSLALGKQVETPAEASVLSTGSDTGVVAFHRKLGQASEMTVRYRVDAFQPILHLEYEIDWHEKQSLLKVLFPTAYSGTMARFGAPFGSVLRNQQPGRERDEAMFEAAASRWAMVSDDGETEGLGVITEAKYGFSCREGMLGVSLLRSPKVTGEDIVHSRLFPASLRRGGPREPFADQGRHVIRLALCAHSPSSPRTEMIPVLADTLFTPPIAYRGAKTIQSPFLGLEGGNSLNAVWAKPAADKNGWILRLNETFGQRGAARLKLAKGYIATRTNLSEETISPRPTTTIHFGPYDLLSYRIQRA